MKKRKTKKARLAEMTKRAISESKKPIPDGARIIIGPKINEQDSSSVMVGVNGKFWYLQRNTIVTVPLAVVEVFTKTNRKEMECFVSTQNENVKITIATAHV